jgi:uncharacterized membrane-anchored protein
MKCHVVKNLSFAAYLWSTPVSVFLEGCMRLRVAVALMFVFALTRASVSQEAQENKKPQIDWQKGPTTGDLEGYAEIKVPEGFMFTDKKGAQRVLELTHNLISGKEVGAMVPAAQDQNWFVIFEFDDVGLVKDDEKDKIDATALLKSLTQGTEEANKERSERGWSPYHLRGWEKPPYYDARTHNLNWSIRGEDDAHASSVNHSVRLLGRRGTLNVDLVLSPEEYAQVLPAFEGVMEGVQFKQGHRYSDFVSGDKVATYGLTALIAGGAGAAALKLGLFAKFWKVLLGIVLALKKLLIVIFAALAAGLKKLWAKITRKKTEDASASTTESEPTEPVGPEALLMNQTPAQETSDTPKVDAATAGKNE